MTPPRRALVVIPVYGHVELTHQVLGDLESEEQLVDVVVVDNKGDYQSRGSEQILRPDRNLGWAGGTNAGTIEGRRPTHEGVLWLNNDTRLSPGFVAGLLDAARQAGAGIVAPFYDCHWYHQRDTSGVAAKGYQPQPRHYLAPFVDGTAMLVTASTIDRVGLLDADGFAPLGWGAEIDYCLTARQAGLRVVVTRAAYLNHARAVTATSLFEGYEGYLAAAFHPAVAGLERKWGGRWQDLAAIDPPDAADGAIAAPPARTSARSSGVSPAPVKRLRARGDRTTGGHG